MLRILEGALAFNQRSAEVDAVGAVQAATIVCSSQLVETATDFQLNRGDLFSLRVPGNFVPPYGQAPGSAAAYMLELVVRQNLRHMVVMGHSDCVAMADLLRGDSDFLHNSWLRHGFRAKELYPQGMNYESGLSDVDRLSQMNVRFGLENLAGYPDIAARLADGAMHLLGWWMDSRRHLVLAYDPAENRFSPIDRPYVERVLAQIGESR